MQELKRRLNRIKGKLASAGVAPDEVPQLLRYWKEHGCFPVDLRPNALEAMEGYVAALRTMQDSVPPSPSERVYR